MTWREDDIVTLSSLQHWTYCPRQSGLILLEQTFDENLYTLRGQRAHAQVDEEGHRRRGDTETHHGVPLWSDRLGLRGRADAVERLPDGSVHPVEHKVGPRKSRDADDIQLCAQAICLEEMLETHIATGAVFYHATRRRRTVEFTPTLRARVEETIHAIRTTMRTQRLPPPVADARCEKCSLYDSCLPHVIQNARASHHHAP